MVLLNKKNWERERQKRKIKRERIHKILCEARKAWGGSVEIENKRRESNQTQTRMSFPIISFSLFFN